MRNVNGQEEKVDLDTLKKWMLHAGQDFEEDADGFLHAVRGNLETSVACPDEADLVVCFAPLLELSGLDEAHRAEVLSQALALNGVGSLPPGCALSYDEAADAVYLLWQQDPDELDDARFGNALDDFGTAAGQVQGYLRGLAAADGGARNDVRAADNFIKV